MIRQAFLNIRRYNSITMDITVLLIFILFFIGASYLVKINLDNFEIHLKERIQIAVFLKDDTDIETAKQEIKKSIADDLKDIFFINKDYALTMLKKETNLDLEINTLDENPLKNHFVIKLKNNSEAKLEKTVKKLKRFSFVADIVRGENMIKNLNIFLNYVITVYFIFVIFAVVIFMFLFKYSIKIYGHYRQKEFVLWKYLAAKRYVIIFTVLFEAIFIGLFSSVIAYLILYLFYMVSSKFLFLFDIVFFEKNFAVFLLVCSVSLACIINLIVLSKSKNVKNLI